MRLAFVLLGAAVAACTNDAFTGGGDGGPLDDSATESSTQTDSSDDAPATNDGSVSNDGSVVSDASIPFCLASSQHFFCKDFDQGEVNPWDGWSGNMTPADLTFGVGSTKRGLSASGTSKAYVDQQEVKALNTLTFDMQLPTVATGTFMTVTSGSNVLKLAIPALSTTLTLTGTPTTSTATTAADTAWHTFSLQFGANGTVTFLENNTKIGTVSFPQPTSFELDLGLLAGSLGDTVLFDNVVMD